MTHFCDLCRSDGWLHTDNWVGLVLMVSKMVKQSLDDARGQNEQLWQALVIAVDARRDVKLSKHCMDETYSRRDDCRPKSLQPSYVVQCACEEQHLLHVFPQGMEKWFNLLTENKYYQVVKLTWDIAYWHRLLRPGQGSGASLDSCGPPNLLQSRPVFPPVPPVEQPDRTKGTKSERHWART